MCSTLGGHASTQSPQPLHSSEFISTVPRSGLPIIATPSASCPGRPTKSWCLTPPVASIYPDKQVYNTNLPATVYPQAPILRVNWYCIYPDKQVYNTNLPAKWELAGKLLGN